MGNSLSCCSEVRSTPPPIADLLKKSQLQVQAFNGIRLKSYMKSLSYNNFKLRSLIVHATNSTFLFSVLEKTVTPKRYTTVQFSLADASSTFKAAELAQSKLNELYITESLEFVGIVSREADNITLVMESSDIENLAEFYVQVMPGPLDYKTLQETLNSLNFKSIISMIEFGDDFLLFYKKSYVLKTYKIEIHEIPSSVQTLSQLIDVSNFAKEFVTVIASKKTAYLVYS